MEQTRTVDIGEFKYQIGRFSARNGSWILLQIMQKMLPALLAQEESKRKGSPVNIERLLLSPNLLLSLPESDFHTIQDHCLAVCSRHEKGVPLPVFSRESGRFTFPDLETDLVTVMALTAHVLVFNLTDFFLGRGLKDLVDNIPGRHSHDTQHSTHTSGAR